MNAILVSALAAIILVLAITALCLFALVIVLQRKLRDAKEGVGLTRVLRELGEAEERASQAEAAALIRATEEMKRREKTIRADAIARSTAVVRGKVAEHLVPFTEDFDFNPRDCRFLGSPIDYIVFDGLTEGTLGRVVFVEVKTGKSKSLSARERQVRNVVNEGKVSWELLHVQQQEASANERHCTRSP